MYILCMLHKMVYYDKQVESQTNERTRKKYDSTNHIVLVRKVVKTISDGHECNTE